MDKHKPEIGERFRVIEDYVNQRIPFNQLLGIRVKELRHGMAKLHLKYRPEMIGDPRRPSLHGGVVSTLIDTAGGAAAATTLTHESDRMSTIDLRVDYLLPGPLEDLEAVAEVVRKGNHVCVVRIAVHGVSNPGTVIAEGKAVYHISRG